MKTTINVSHNGAPQTVFATPITGNELYDAFGVAAYETLYRKGHGGNADDLINRSSVDEYQVNENDVFHTEKTEPLPVVNVTLDDKAQTVASRVIDGNGLYLHFAVATDRTLFRKVAGSTAEQILRNTTPLTVSEGDSFYTKVS